MADSPNTTRRWVSNHDQQQAYDALLRAARGDLRVVEAALIDARRAAGAVPTYAAVLARINAREPANV
jgi:hypothetical protein